MTATISAEDYADAIDLERIEQMAQEPIVVVIDAEYADRTKHAIDSGVLDGAIVIHADERGDLLGVAICARRDDESLRHALDRIVRDAFAALVDLTPKAQA